MLGWVARVAQSLVSVQPPAPPPVAPSVTSESEDASARPKQAVQDPVALAPTLASEEGGEADQRPAEPISVEVNLVRIIDPCTYIIQPKLSDPSAGERSLCASLASVQALDDPPVACKQFVHSLLQSSASRVRAILDRQELEEEIPDRLSARLLVDGAGVGERDVEVELLRHGWARLARPAPNLDELIAAEREARSARAGMWAELEAVRELGPLPVRVRRVMAPTAFLVDVDLTGVELPDEAKPLADRAAGITFRLANVRAPGSEERLGAEALREARRLTYSAKALTATFAFGPSALAAYDRRERGCFAGSLAADGLDVGAGLVARGLATVAPPFSAADARSPAFEGLLRAALAAEPPRAAPEHRFCALRWTPLSPADLCPRVRGGPGVLLGHGVARGGPLQLRVEVEWDLPDEAAPAGGPPPRAHSAVTLVLSAPGEAGRAVGVPGGGALPPAARALLEGLVDRELAVTFDAPAGPCFAGSAAGPALGDLAAALLAAGLAPVPACPALPDPPAAPRPLAAALCGFPLQYLSVCARTAGDMALDAPHFLPGGVRPTLGPVPSLRTVDFAADLAPDPPPFQDEALLAEAAREGCRFVCAPQQLAKLLCRAAWAMPEGGVHRRELASVRPRRGAEAEAAVQGWQASTRDSWRCDFVLSRHAAAGGRVWAVSSAAGLVEAEREAGEAEEAAALPGTLEAVAAAEQALDARHAEAAARRRFGPWTERLVLRVLLGGADPEGGERGAWAPEAGLPPSRESCSRLVTLGRLAARAQLHAGHGGQELVLVGRLMRGCRKAASLRQLYNKGELAEKRGRGLQPKELAEEQDSFLAAKAIATLARLAAAGWPPGGALVAYHNGARVHGLHVLTAERLAAACLADGIQPRPLFAALAAAIERLLERAAGALEAAGGEAAAWRGRLEVVRYGGALQLAVLPLGSPPGEAEPLLAVEEPVAWPAP